MHLRHMEFVQPRHPKPHDRFWRRKMECRVQLNLYMTWLFFLQKPTHDDVIKWKYFLKKFPTQGPVMRSFDVFFDLRLNKWLSKQLWSWWFEMPLHSLWRHCNKKTCPRSLMCVSCEFMVWWISCTFNLVYLSVRTTKQSNLMMTEWLLIKPPLAQLSAMMGQRATYFEQWWQSCLMLYVIVSPGINVLIHWSLVDSADW